MSDGAVTVGWRLLTGVSVAASGFLGIAIDLEIPVVFVQLVQFGTIVLACVVLCLGSRPASFSRTSVVFISSLALFVLGAAIGAIFSIDQQASLSSTALTAVMFTFLAATLCLRWEVDTSLIIPDLRFAMLVVGGCLLVGVSLALVGYPGVFGDYGRFTGVFTNANYAGAVAALSLVLTSALIAQSSRAYSIPLIVTLLLSAGTLALSGSRTSIVAAAVGLVALVLIKRRTWVVRALALCLCFGVIVAVLLFPVSLVRGQESLPSSVATDEPGQPASEVEHGPSSGPHVPPDERPVGESVSDRDPTPPVSQEPELPLPEPSADPGEALNDQSSGRLDIALRSLSLFAQSPVLGVGLGAAGVALGGVETHNFALQVMLETGLVGVVALLGVVVLVGAALVAVRPLPWLTGGVLVVLVTETALSTMLGWGGPTALLFWLVIVAFCASRGDTVGSLFGRRAE